MKQHQPTSSGRLFPALLKYWRGARGLSQLDLGLAADVSARHVSFLETGRAKPSEEMVLTLASTLQIPLREQNTLLQAAGFESGFEEPSIENIVTTPMGKALEHMMKQHEPYPMIVMDRAYDLLMINNSGTQLLQAFINKPESLKTPINMFEVIFDPDLARPFIHDWTHTAHTMLSRLHREALLAPHNHRLSDLVEKLLTYPDVPEAWRLPDFSQVSEPTYTVRLIKDDMDLAFLTTMSNFSAPQNITLEELLIEGYFPLDDKTAETCRKLAETDS